MQYLYFYGQTVGGLEQLNLNTHCTSQTNKLGYIGMKTETIFVTFDSLYKTGIFLSDLTQVYNF